VGSDRLREFIELLVERADRGGEEVAARAYLSRFHFDRLVGAALRETPGAFRRRLLLERAAWQLRNASVTDAAHDAGYSSLEAFSRAFGRAYGEAPSRYRGDFRLPAQNGVHFHPPGGLRVPAERSDTMDLTDRMLDHDLWLTRQLIDAAAGLPEAQIDEPNPVAPPTAAFHEDAPSIRSMLNRLVFTKEMWAAAIEGRTFVENEDTSIDSLRRRLDESGSEFRRLVVEVRDRGDWDTAFVDATCDPPESFSYGGAVAHVLTWNAHRRQILAGTLRERGLVVEDADPIRWEPREA